jgi:REP element-mobilizing transposase RayT
MPNTSPTHREFNHDHTPLAYFITFRSYGTWLHGDNRGSVDRMHNTYGTPHLPANSLRQNYERRLLKRPPVKLTLKRRAAIERGIRDTCRFRKWLLWALNVRTNHVHTVVSAVGKSKQVLATLKANATRVMRESKCWDSKHTPWADRGSRRHIWTQKQLLAVIDYVLYDQGEPLP